MSVHLDTVTEEFYGEFVAVLDADEGYTVWGSTVEPEVRVLIPIHDEPGGWTLAQALILAERIAHTLKEQVTCIQCDGLGYVDEGEDFYDAWQELLVTCYTCDGVGSVQSFPSRKDTP